MKKLSLFITLTLSTMNVFSAQNSAQMNVSLVITANPCETSQFSTDKITTIRNTCSSPVAIVDNDVVQPQEQIAIKTQDVKNHRITIMY
jgi:hypothetical protein